MFASHEPEQRVGLSASMLPIHATQCLWANMGGRAGLTKRPDGTAELHVEHVKNAEAGYTLEVRPERVTVQLEDGPFDTIVAQVTTAAAGTPVKGKKARKSRELSEDQRTAIKAVARATLERPAARAPCPDIPAGIALTTEAAAVEMIARLVSTTTRNGGERPAKKQREHAARLLHSLHARFFVRIVDGLCWLDPKAAAGEDE